MPTPPPRSWMRSRRSAIASCAIPPRSEIPCCGWSKRPGKVRPPPPEVPYTPLMRNDRLQLLLASALMLFTELVLIRWAGAYVVYLSYFSNFVLLGSFLGVGLGFLRSHRGPDLFKWAPLALVLFVAFVKIFPVQIDRTGGQLIYF